MKFSIPIQLDYIVKYQVSAIETANSLKAQAELFHEAILVIEKCFPELNVEQSDIFVKNITQNSPLRNRLEGMVLAAFQDGFVEEVPQDILNLLFGIDVPDSYESTVSALIIVITLWGAEKVIQKIRRYRGGDDAQKFEERAKTLRSERDELTKKSAMRLGVPVEKLEIALVETLASHPAKVEKAALDFIAPARKHDADAIESGKSIRINKKTLSAMPSQTELASLKPPKKTQYFENVEVRFLAHDLQKSKKWAATIDEISKSRCSLHLAPDINPEDLFTLDRTNADVLVTYALDREGEYFPEMYYLATVRQSPSPP